MLDDLTELRTFRAVLAAGSLSAAARELGTSLAVVSARLDSLEARAGVPLVHRTTEPVSPTDEGVGLLVDVERALGALAAGEERLASGRETVVGTLNVSAPVSFGRQHVAPVLGRLAREHPRLEVSLRLEDRPVDLARDGLDVAVRVGEPADSSAAMRKLTDNRRVLVASPEYLDRAGRPLAVSDLEGHQFLRYGSVRAPWRLRGSGGKTATVAAPARLRADSGDVVRDWALAGHGIALKSAIDVARDLERGTLERVLPQWHGAPAPVVASYPSVEHVPRKTRLFLDALAESLERAVARAGGS
jgi:DNA-binding transcriptional LysR family regulator